MKRKKLILSEEKDLIFSDQKTKISKSENEWTFEIGKYVTNDVAEGVSLLMKNFEKNEDIWNIELDSKSIEIQPEKCLFWMTGGELEWNNLNNYKKSWRDCYLDFQQEFGLLIVDIIEKSKKLKDVKDGFEKHLNLPILYDFAIQKNLVR